MTQEDKQLLLEDLCARLPYGVIVEDLTYTPAINVELSEYCMCEEVTVPQLIKGYADKIKPYLRPLSSMTEEEREVFRMLGGVMSYSPQHNTWVLCAFAPEAYDYLNAHHFDYRKLISKGLALEAPEGMYKND